MCEKPGLRNGIRPQSKRIVKRGISKPFVKIMNMLATTNQVMIVDVDTRDGGGVEKRFLNLYRVPPHCSALCPIRESLVFIVKH